MATMATSMVGTDHWNVEVYGSLSLASRLSAAINQRTLPYKLSFSFWKVNKGLGTFLSEIDELMSKAQSGLLPGPDEPITPARIKNAIDSLMNLHYMLNSIYENAKRKGLTNSSLLVSGISRLHRNDERIEDLAHWLMDMQNPQEFESIFESALAELRNGETVTVDD